METIECYLPTGRGELAALSVSNDDAVSGRALAVLIPHWVNDVLGGAISTAMCASLARIQETVVAALLEHDARLDCDMAERAAAGDALPLLASAHRELSRLLPFDHGFWKRYARLLQLQAASSAWELRARGRPPRALDRRLIRELGQKAAVLRWPAFAMAALAGRPQDAAVLDRTVRRFLSLLQLLDDLVDVDDDLAGGQPNAVVAASVPFRDRGDSTAIALLLGACAVCSVAGELANDLANEAPSGSGFARLAGDLRECCRGQDELHERRLRLMLAHRVLGGVGVQDPAVGDGNGR